MSAVFWLLVIHDSAQRSPESALTLAGRLYKEATLVPYLARFSVFCRENFPRAWLHTLRIYCMTDDKAEKVRQLALLYYTAQCVYLGGETLRRISPSCHLC